MSAQDWYNLGNAEYDAAQVTDSSEGSQEHALLACAAYLRAITEMLGTKFKSEENKS